MLDPRDNIHLGSTLTSFPEMISLSHKTSFFFIEHASARINKTVGGYIDCDPGTYPEEI